MEEKRITDVQAEDHKVVDTEQTEENASAEMEQQAQRMKKKLIRVLCAILALLVVGVGAVALITELTREDEVPGYEYEEKDFYPTYQGNIMEYKAYLDLDRSISYCADPAGYGETSTITEENRKDYSEEVLFLYDYVQTIIAGDATAYNACFNGNYYKNNELLEAFPPQMIYQTKITYVKDATNDVEDDIAGADKLYLYRLEYMIFQNDGKFRRDIASDASRPQNVLLRVTPEGRISIENITTIYYQ